MSAAVALAARLALAATLAVSALAKLLAGSRLDALVPGVPEPLQRTLSRVVPAAELAVAGALVVFPFRSGPAWAALALLVAFTVVMLVGMRGSHPAPCNCFGAWSAEPVGGTTLVRNAWLVALAVIASGTRAGASRPVTVVMTALALVVTAGLVRGRSRVS